MLTCWVVTDGKAGMESQCLGLAQALGITPVVKRVRLRPFWRVVTPYLRLGGRRQFAPESDSLAPPWPNLVIATGRQSIAAALWIKSASRGHTRLVQLQNPGFAWNRFDLIVVPEHDRLFRANVISTRGALHRITPSLLARSREQWARVFAPLPRPRIAVLIGGSNSAYRLGPTEMEKLARKLVACAHSMQGSLMVTPSRRTGREAMQAFTRAVAGVPNHMWDMQGENPYFGILASADFIVVTSDSVNMISEAASTGKPVYVEHLPGGSAKSARFLDGLREAGIVRDFAGELAPYAYAPPDDMTAVVECVQQLLRADGAPASAGPGNTVARAATNA